MSSQSKTGTADPVRNDKISWGLVAAGILLLLLALVLLVYALLYTPTDRHPPARLAPTPTPTPTSAGSVVSPQPIPSKLNVPKEEPEKGTRRKQLSKHTKPRNFQHPRSNKNSPAEVVTAAQYYPLASQRFQKTSTAEPSATPSAPTRKRPCPELTWKAKKEPGFFQRLINRIKRWFGREDREEPLNTLPVIDSFTVSRDTITLSCAPGTHSASGGCAATPDSTVLLTASASDKDEDTLSYDFDPSRGRIVGGGASVVWDLSGLEPGTYSVTVQAKDGCGFSKALKRTVEIVNCGDCIPDMACPEILFRCADAADEGAPITFTANVVRGTPPPSSYNWTVSAGRISSGDGTNTITVDTRGTGGQTITATVELGGLDPSCGRTDSCSTAVRTSCCTLSGKVFDRNQVAVSGATVTARGPNGQGSSPTNANGEYSIQNLPPGTYRVEVNVSRFQTSSPIEVTLNGSQSLNIPFGGSNVATPTPTPTRSPVTSPSPTPSPSASPSQTASPSPSVCPSPTRRKTQPGKDQVKVTYRDRFLTGRSDEIRFELNRVPLPEQMPTSTVSNNNKTDIGTPPPNPEGSPGLLVVDQFGDCYTAYATVRLITSDLEIVSGSDGEEKSLEPSAVAWTWLLTPKDNSRAQARFYFQVDIVWRAQGLTNRYFSYVWYDESDTPPVRNKPFASPIGPSALMVGASKTFPIPGVMGVLALRSARRRRRRSSDDEGEDDGEVRTTVFSPSQASPGASFFVQVFAHLPRDARLLKKIAQQTERDAELVDSDLLDQPIQQGARLTFFLTMPGLEIDEAKQTRVWNGKRIRVQFGVTVPKESEPRDILAKVIVCENTMPIGHLGFKFKIVGSATEAASAPADVGTVRAYKQAFISYAHEDKAEVLKRVQMLEVERKKYFRDQDLKSGEQWGPVLYQRIDESDVFFLFWSEAASKSEWVQKEIDHALSRQAGNREAPPHIYPVVLPPPVKPPEVLSYLQFGDRISREIFAADAISTSSRENKISDREQ